MKFKCQSGLKSKSLFFKINKRINIKNIFFIFLKYQTKISLLKKKAISNFSKIEV